MRGVLVCFASTLAVGTVSVGAPMPAAACGNEYVYSVDEAVRSLANAERYLGVGRFGLTFTTSLSVLRSLEYSEGALREFGANEGGWAPDDETRERSRRRVEQLSARAKRLLAIAMVRLDGATTFEQPRRSINSTLLQSPTDEQRQQSLTWALGVLTEARAAAAEDPVIAAHLAEALGKFPDRRAEGIALLQDLASRDLMPDAWAYRAFAVMLEQAASPGRDEAVLQCRTRAGRRARRICPDLE